MFFAAAIVGLNFSSPTSGNNIVIDVRQLILGMSGLRRPREQPITRESYQITVNASNLIAVPLSSPRVTAHTGRLWHTMDTNNLKLPAETLRVWSLLYRTISMSPLVWHRKRV
jgi:hypothetical protein